MTSTPEPETAENQETSFSLERDPAPSPLRMSNQARLTRVDLSVENLRGCPINFNAIKLDLDRLFEKLQLTYESDKTIDKSVYKLKASVQTSQFAQKLTYWIYFHLKYHNRNKVHFYTGSTSISGSDEMTETDEQNMNSDKKTKIKTASDGLMTAAKFTAHKFVGRFFGKTVPSPDKPESPYIRSAVQELEKDLSSIVNPGCQCSQSPVCEDDLSDAQLPKTPTPSKKDKKTPGFHFPFGRRDNLQTAVPTSGDSIISKRKCRPCKHVSFDHNLPRRWESDEDEVQYIRGISPPRSTNPFEESDNNEEEEECKCTRPAPDDAPLQIQVRKDIEPKPSRDLENSKSGRAGALGDEQYSCATCAGCVEPADLKRFLAETSDTLRCSLCIKSDIPTLVSAVIDRLLHKYPRQSKCMFLKQHSEQLKKELTIHLRSQLSNRKNYEVIRELNTEHFAKVVTKHLLRIYGSPRMLINAAIARTHPFIDDFTTFVKFELVQKRTYKKESFFKRAITPFTRAFTRAAHFIYDKCSPTTQVMIDLSCFGPLFA